MAPERRARLGQSFVGALAHQAPRGARGERARITSEAGSIEAPVEVSDEMAPGVVSLPHGWGHDRPGVRLGVASAHAGVNNDLLAPPMLVDVPSDNAVLNGIPVTVRPA